jgi:hypothetical protein
MAAVMDCTMRSVTCAGAARRGAASAFSGEALGFGAAARRGAGRAMRVPEQRFGFERA